MKHALLIVTVVSSAVLLFAARTPSPRAANPPPPARISSKAVWTPSPSVLSNIRQVCAAGDPDQQKACFLDSMRAAGASDEAAAFVTAFAPNGLAYLRAFRDTGPVDIAYVEYLFRANEMDGVFLVNGTPPLIDVDDYKFLPPDDLHKNADYAALLEKYPAATVFPADRHDSEFPVVTASTKRGQEIQVDYLIQDGCHACARLGTLALNFLFDSSGKFRETRVVSVLPVESAEEDRPMLTRRSDAASVKSSAREANLDPTEVHTTVGDSFTIVLPANHSTGYSWRLAHPLDPAILKQINETYRENNRGRIGIGGKEFWTFEALTKGITELNFEYARPFEKDAAPVNTAKYQIEIK